MDTWTPAAGGRNSPWIFIHDADIVDNGLIVLFSVFFTIFSVAPSPLEEA